jgi:putative SOS response-associated peptidase YedK
LKRQIVAETASKQGSVIYTWQHQGANRSAAGRALRRPGWFAHARGDALGPDPYWAKDIKIGFSIINSRAEEVAVEPAFREAFQGRCCLVPVDNFYE